MGLRQDPERGFKRRCFRRNRTRRAAGSSSFWSSSTPPFLSARMERCSPVTFYVARAAVKEPSKKRSAALCLRLCMRACCARRLPVRRLPTRLAPGSPATMPFEQCVCGRLWHERILCSFPPHIQCTIPPLSSSHRRSTHFFFFEFFAIVGCGFGCAFFGCGFGCAFFGCAALFAASHTSRTVFASPPRMHDAGSQVCSA